MFVVCIGIDRDRIDERLVVGLALAHRDRDGLPMGFGDELRGTDIRHPDLHRPQALAT
jgi:hypothetical protein